MESKDLAIITDAIEKALQPLNTSITEMKNTIADLPCVDHTISINTIETERNTEKEQMKNAKITQEKSRNWMLKVVLAIVAIGGLLQSIGFFRSLK
jgi:hypothetical protein